MIALEVLIVFLVIVNISAVVWFAYTITTRVEASIHRQDDRIRKRRSSEVRDDDEEHIGNLMEGVRNEIQGVVENATEDMLGVYSRARGLDEF